MKINVLLLFVFSFCFSNDMINYQGILLDSETNEFVEDGDYNLTFKLYDTYDANENVWEETIEIAVLNGFYSHNLGSVNSFDNLDFSKKYWIGISIDDNEFARYMLTSTPYSMHSNNSSKIEGYDIANLKDRIMISDDIEIGAQNFTVGQWVNFENLYINIEHEMKVHVTGTFSHEGVGPCGYQFTLYDGNGAFLDNLTNSFTNPPGAQKWVSPSFTMDLDPGNYILALFGYGSSEGDELRRGYFRYIATAKDDNALNHNNDFRFENIPGNIDEPINQ